MILDLALNILDKLQARRQDESQTDEVLWEFKRERTCTPPPTFVQWGLATLKACEATGWTDDQYVEAGFTVGALRTCLMELGAL